MRETNEAVSYLVHKGEMDAINQTLLAKVLLAQLQGITVLPYGLGLSPNAYANVLNACRLPALVQLDQQWHSPQWQVFRARAEVCKEIQKLRADEQTQLVKLLRHCANPSVCYASHIATVIATACLGHAHLYVALGLESRHELKQLFAHNFPSLCALNTNNMRWKRFLYLQLCKSGGDYVCRAPSCNECSSKKECFVA
ncbi:nitrogen fixation protein NifQ [Echinimonas agarilytica]|uniref:Nitrogen fixation protein NifQ n=1 Tax=Echinimonas agarilytica TaxID=1215918 RepID=A0AA41W7A5_9GAMM|nr:nitrogen fixation protein NifQ [Echinimonas agarilytica]MCM2680460.1 nitrogen fixation protein NifQ [Echinimonas agarilytica]